MTSAVASAPPVSTTADAFARYVVEGILAPWPGGRLLSTPLVSALARTVTNVHAATGTFAGGAAPFDRWLGVVAGAPDGRLTGDALARQAADVLLNIANRVGRTPSLLAATALPPPAGTFPSSMPSPLPPIPGGFTPPSGWDQG